MNFIYAVVKEHYALGEENRISYGVVVYSNSVSDGTACIVASVHDITSDEKKVSELVRRCNHLQLSAVHLKDVIEDFFLV